MATEVKLPRLGQGMESGTIVRWLKTEGEAVSKGEPLYELDTDKVTQEVEAESDGVLLKIVIADGEVDVGTTVGIIGAQDEDVAALLADSQGENGDAPAATAATPVSETPAPSRPSDAAPASEVKVEPLSHPRRHAPSEHVKAEPTRAADRARAGRRHPADRRHGA
jgi:pyruvate/2-oxoglutarate dehydrogenase complex dihydrolipoamide acyltransferase (E2) component